jgi:thermitase
MTVKLIDTTLTFSLDELIRESNIEIIRKNKLGYIDLRIPEKSEFTVVLKKYLNSSLFESVEMNSYGKVFEDDPDDPGYSSQHHLDNGDNYPHIHGYYYGLWAWEDGSSHPVIVAVLDLGVDKNNADLHLWDGPGTSFGWDYVEEDPDPSPQQRDDHGTGIAGIIGAKTNNGEGVAGIAGGYNSDGTQIMAMRVGKSVWHPVEGWKDEIYSEHIDDAIIDAADDGAQIISMSFGGGEDAAINAAISYAYKEKGCLLVAATGNDHINKISYPASHDWVMAIAGIKKNGDAYGNYGEELDVVAPAEDIITTLNIIDADQYRYGNIGWGTSFSAPQVAGAAALLCSTRPPLTNRLLPSEIRYLINQTATYKGDPDRFGNGLLFPGLALEMLLDSPEVEAPYISLSGGLGSHPTISWSKVGNNISYRVYRASTVDGGRYYFIQKASIPYDPAKQTYSWTDNSVTISRFGPITYYYRVTSVEDGIESLTSNERSCRSNSAQKPLGEITLNEETLELYHNFPNPFNPLTNIRFNLNKEQRVIIKVYDINGKLVDALVDKTMQKGRHSVRFDAKDLASGVYFYTFNAGDIKLTRKMMLLR